MTSILTQPKRDELGQMLDAAGSVYDPEGVGALIAGVLAAPAEIGIGWHVLVADPMPQPLADRLEALRDAMAAGYHDGSLCRAATSIRANTCHRVASASLG